MTLKSASLLALVASLSPAPLLAGDLLSPADVTLLPGWRMENGNHMAALRVTLDDGWKTYWRAPGEGGIPPLFDWSRSENIASVDYHWPVPEVFPSGGLTTIGYHHELILPIEIAPETPGEDMVVRAELLLGVCENICMPMEAALDVVLPADQTLDAPAITAALMARPETEAEAGIAAVRCTLTPIVDGIRVDAEVTLPSLGEDEWMVFEAANDDVWVSEPMVHRSGDTLFAQADFVPPEAAPFDLDAETLRLTVLGQGRGIDIHGCDAS